MLQRKKDQLLGQYKLDNVNAKISALSSKDIDKYELLTDNHLGIRPSTLDNSPLSSVINKGIMKKKIDKIDE